jgi:hypothetical protein
VGFDNAQTANSDPPRLVRLPRPAALKEFSPSRRRQACGGTGLASSRPGQAPAGHDRGASVRRVHRMPFTLHRCGAFGCSVRDSPGGRYGSNRLCCAFAKSPVSFDLNGAQTRNIRSLQRGFRRPVRGCAEDAHFQPSCASDIRRGQ